ncbi:MAG: ACT domain-containing protein [Acidimicrobiales bacterium]
MPTFHLRVQLADRPGALGLVASRIGSVGADIVAIEILERVDGTVIDEFILQLPSAELVELLRSEVHEVDGVRIERLNELPD